MFHGSGDAQLAQTPDQPANWEYVSESRQKQGRVRVDTGCDAPDPC